MSPGRMKRKAASSKVTCPWSLLYTGVPLVSTWGQQQIVGKGRKGVATEMGQSIRKKTKEGKEAILPRPKHRETACRIRHSAIQLCQLR